MAFNPSRFCHLSDVTVTSIIEEVILVEGGYINHKDDRGGETMYGITKSTANRFRHLWAKRQFNGDMRTLSKALAFDIYYEGYWKPNYCDQLFDIHPLIAFHVFDLAVNGGGRTVGRHVQRLINVLNRKERDYPDIVVDGNIGPATIRALSSYRARNGEEAIRKFVMMLVSMQGSFYIQVTEARHGNETFMNGWMNRTVSKMVMFSRLMHLMP